MSEAAVMATEKQAVPKGYKQTEAGVIPEDWDIHKLDDICNLINGRGFKPYEWSDEGLPIIRIQNLNGSEDFNFFNGSYNPKILIKKGQLLFAWSGSRGTSFGPHIWNGEDALLNYHTWKVEINQNINSDYFYYALKSITKVIEDAAHGASALVHTQMGEMKKFLVVLPSSKKEQTAIANALSDMDALLTEMEQLIAKKQAIKTATMQQLLTGKTRLPQFATHTDGEYKGQPKGMKHSELGEIPEDWEVVPISRVCSIYGRIGFRGYTKEDIVSEDQGVISISPSNISNGKLHYDKSTYITWEKYHESPEIKIFEGDVLLVKTGSTYGKVGLVEGLQREATLNPQVVVLKNRKCPSSLLAHIMQFEIIQKQIEETIVGGAIPTLSQKSVLNYLIPLPSNKREQTAIANILSDMDAEIQALEQRLAKTRQIKQGMMQELLTGKTRLPVGVDD